MFLGFGENLQEKWGLDNDAQLFFILRWQELFDLETYHSWRVRTSSVKTILNELIIGLEMAKTVPNSYTSLDFLLDEALEIAKTDIIVKEYYPLISFQINNLKTLFDENKNEKKRDLELIERYIGLISAQLSNYKKYLVKYLKQYLQTPKTNFKNDLYGVAMSLAIELSYQSFSHIFLKEKIEILQNKNNGDFSKRLDIFISTVDCEKKDFTVYFPIRISLKDIASKKVEGVSFLNSNDLPGGLLEKFALFKKEYSGFHFAQVSNKAVDPYGAYEHARRKVERALASIRLFHFEGDADLITDAIIKNDEEQIVSIDYFKIYNNYLHNTKKPLTKVEELSNVIDNLKSRDKERISAVLQYHRLAMAAHTDEARLVNLWVALECLVRVPGKTIISNVCDLVIPSLATQHMHGVIRGLAIDLRHAWRSPQAKILHDSIGIDSDNPRDIPLDKLITWLVQTDEREEIKCLYKLVTNNPLGVYRLDRIQKKYLKDYEIFCELLKKHSKHLKWQIMRIYRTRNLLVHWGQYSPSLEQLTQHLHSYLITTLQNILRDLTWNKSWTIVQALEFRHHLCLFTKICTNQRSFMICVLGRS